MVRVISSKSTWTPIRPFLVSLNNAGLIYIKGFIQGSVERNDVNVSIISGSVENFKFYKKVEDGSVNVYIYSETDSKNPAVVYLKRRNSIGDIIKNVSDLSGYEEIIPK